MAARIDFQTEPARYRHWKLEVRRRGGRADHGRRRERRPVRGLSAQAQLLRPRRRHRARRCRAAAALRASRGEGGGAADPARTACSAPAPTSACWRAPPTPTRSTSASSPTRRATPWRMRARSSGQKYMCAMRGTAAGGGYELALATDHILLADDGNSTVALPELPLLAVLPGTGGLTRVTDKRKVRRDLADAFCTVEEGVQGRARRQVAAGRPGRAQLQVRRRRVKDAARKLAAKSDRPTRRQGHRARRRIAAHDRRRCRHLFEREGRDRPRNAPRHHHHRRAQRAPPPASAEAMHAAGRRVLAAAARARAGRCHPASAPQRGRDRRADLQVAGRAGPGARLRRVPRRQQGPLARARDPALLEARAEARRRHLALAGGADRARQLLCRHAGRDRLRLRPLLHAGRRAARATTARRRRSRSRRSTSAPTR